MYILQAENIKKRFGKLEVLKGVTLNVKKGEVIAVIGPSGSGKSTFIRCLNHLESINSGKIVIDGAVLVETVDNKAVYPKEKVVRKVCEKTGMVFQSFNLFPHMTVLENITAAPINVKNVPKDEAVKTARELLSQVGLSEKEASYPSALSGGQQQRVAIARALALNPDILFFDEPTSALDPELTGEVLRVIKNLAKAHMTMIIVTHEMNFAREVSDRIVFMDEGEIIADETPEYFFGDEANDRIKAFLQKLE